MKNISFALLLAGLSAPALAGPFIVSDAVPASETQPTHCGVWLNALPRTEIPVTASAAGPYCKYDLVGLTVGSHTIRLSHVRKDAVWGDQESAQSAPFGFNKPGAPRVPSGTSLSP